MTSARPPKGEIGTFEKTTSILRYCLWVTFKKKSDFWKFRFLKIPIFQNPDFWKSNFLKKFSLFYFDLKNRKKKKIEKPIFQNPDFSKSRFSKKSRFFKKSRLSKSQFVKKLTFLKIRFFQNPDFWKSRFLKILTFHDPKTFIKITISFYNCVR